MVLGLMMSGLTAWATLTDRSEAQAQRPNPVELGWVDWQRDYDVAAAEAKKTGKPMFLLFQEVPGCSTCVNFGESVLSHPLLIETIETDFVPVAIHNNKGGKDRAVLKRFGEPSWNNPVVRFVTASGEDLIPRADGVWSTSEIARRAVKALERAKRPVPDYLRWVVEESAPQASARFSMYCYWSGEACLGDIEGVLSTHTAHLGGREIVEVVYDPKVITEKSLRTEATSRSCGTFVASRGQARSASRSDQKYFLQRSIWDQVPLTERQMSRVNAALGKRQSPHRWVSPRQRALHQQISKERGEKK